MKIKKLLICICMAFALIFCANSLVAFAATEITWPGNNETTVYDQSEGLFSADSSGLDFYNGQLFVVENGDGMMWVLDVAKNGTLSFASGYSKGKGKKIKFKTNPSSSKAADTEGITADEEGFVYVCTERDSANKSVSKNAVLKVDPKASGDTVVATQEWNLTSSLPKVSDSNVGLEAVEWVSNSELEGKLYDKNKGGLFKSSNYPNQAANGVFFVALEDNGHVYAYILNKDETSVQIADIDTGLGCAMALDYDVSQDVLWTATDNNKKNLSVQIIFNGANTPSITQVKPASTVSTGENYEGFAIATDDYATNGEKPVFKLMDGKETQILLVGSIRVNYSTGGNDNTGSSSSKEEITNSSKPEASKEEITNSSKPQASKEEITNSSKPQASKEETTTNSKVESSKGGAVENNSTQETSKSPITRPNKSNEDLSKNEEPSAGGCKSNASAESSIFFVATLAVILVVALKKKKA